MNTFLELVKNRESCRNFSQKKVDIELLEQCAEAARLAPSACNAQPWHFSLAVNPDVVKKIAKATQKLGMNKFTENCPSFIIINEEEANKSAKLGAKLKKHDYSQIDIGIAAAHICYTATDLGLGSCILGWFDENDIKKLLNIDENKRVRLIIAIGYSENDALRKKVRKSKDETISIYK